MTWLINIINSSSMILVLINMTINLLECNQTQMCSQVIIKPQVQYSHCKIDKYMKLIQGMLWGNYKFRLITQYKHLGSCLRFCHNSQTILYGMKLHLLHFKKEMPIQNRPKEISLKMHIKKLKDCAENTPNLVSTIKPSKTVNQLWPLQASPPYTSYS